MQQIVIYVDKGVDGISLKQTVKSLRQEIDTACHPLKRMNGAQLKTENWEKETALIVFPGGRDVFYQEALQGVGTEKIRSFVEGGGGYLGLCAGAYFAAQSIEFEKGGDLEVCANRSLLLYPDIAEGPAYGKNRYQYDGLQGIEAAHLSWKKGGRFHAYFNGGCSFVGANKYPNVEILASYLELENEPAAVVLCQVGQGAAALCGVHLEYSTPTLYRNNPYIERIFPLLEKGESKRKEVFRQLLRSLKVSLN